MDKSSDTEWIFTFGVGQVDEFTGRSMAGLYVKLRGDHEEARHAMVTMFGTGWAFQYPANHPDTKAMIEKYHLSEWKPALTGVSSVMKGAAPEPTVAESKLTTIGGTDIAVALGLSEWSSPFDLWARLKGLVPPREDNDRLEMGRLLEPIVLQKYQRATGYEVETGLPSVSHPKLPWFTGHLDGLAKAAALRVVDAKTIDTHAGRPGDGRWSQPDDLQPTIPPDYFWQLQGYMALVPDAAFGDIAAQFGFSRFVIYSLPRDPELIARMLERLEAWYVTHVLGDEPPPVRATETSKAVRNRLFPANTSDEIRPTTAEEEEILYALKHAEQAHTIAEAQYDDLRERVRFMIGSQKGVEGEWGRATWTKQKDTVKDVTDWEAIAREVADVHGLDIPAELIVKHSSSVVTKEGPRVLRVNFKKG